jgi:hypothetical protein
MILHHEDEGIFGQNDITKIMLDYLESNIMANIRTPVVFW